MGVVAGKRDTRSPCSGEDQRRAEIEIGIAHEGGEPVGKRRRIRRAAGLLHRCADIS